MKPIAPVARKVDCQPYFLGHPGHQQNGATAPMLAPELKIPVATPRWRLGNHSATVLMQAGKFAASPKPRKTRAIPNVSAVVAGGVHHGGQLAEPTLPLIERKTDGLRIAVAGGYFRSGVPAEAAAAVAEIAAVLGASREVELPEAGRARAAAYVITAAEGAGLHLDRLRRRAVDYDPAVRDRLIAGAMIPAAMVAQAQKFRRWYRERALALFDEVDAILAPATPCTAPLLGQETFVVNGTVMPVGASLGLYTQPISFIGLPVVVVPVPLRPLPIGVQIIAAPWREDVALRIAHALETAGAVAAPRPAM